MARQNETDRLFRESLASLEVTPDVASWQAVQTQMKNKPSKIIWWRVAAAVAVLAISSVLILRRQADQPLTIAGIADHPVIQESKLPNITLPVRPIQIAKAEPIRFFEPVVTKEQKQNEKWIAIEPIPTPERLKIRSILMDMTEPILAIVFDQHTTTKPTEPIQLTQVKITYIATEMKENKGLNKVLLAAQNLSTAELLADLRDAKNEILSRN